MKNYNLDTALYLGVTLIYAMLAWLLFDSCVKAYDDNNNEYETLISSQSTVYATTGGYKTRAENIRLAAKAFDGLVVLPGQEVSFNSTVGQRTKEGGYKVSKAIVGGRMTKEIGGGVCQVAGTLYNAVLHTGGLTVTEHHHHTRKSTYLDVGRDATVDWMKKDLKFRNDFSFPVKLFVTFTSVDTSHEEIRFSVFGKEKPFNVEVDVSVLFHRKSTMQVEISNNPKQKRQILVEHGADAYRVHKVVKVFNTKTGQIVSESDLEKINYVLVDGLLTIPQTR